MILPSRGVSVDRDRRSEIRKALKPLLVMQKIESLMERSEMRLSMIFSDEEVNQFCSQRSGKKSRKRAFTPAQTLGLFVSQTISRNEACSTLINRFNKDRKHKGLMPVSDDASGYCRARSRLPIELIDALSLRIGSIARNKALSDWKWMERNVYMVDGFVLRAPDTLKNQEKYPQPSSQKVGLGFPQVRVVTASSLATGSIDAYATAPVEGKRTGEATLFRGILDHFKPHDIILGDSNFESYHDVALLSSRGIDAVFCINGTRNSPLQGECQCIEEVLQTIAKPKLDLNRFTREQWEALPATLTYRIIRYRTSGRSSTLTIVTTLLDTHLYPAQAIAELYGLRWDVEIDIGCFKTTMGQGELRCHTPDNIEREIAVSILAYNLVRLLMNDAAQVATLHPREISFSHSRDAWVAFGKEIESAYDLMWIILSACARFVRDRPGRQEPREIKARHAKYPKLIQPRPSRARMMALHPEPQAA
jgi:hypothetical protein